MEPYIYVSIYDEERIDRILASLSSKIRRDILRLLDHSSYGVSEIARMLNIPVSTAAFHINNLQDSDLINVQGKQVNGAAKIISRKIDEINIRCTTPLKSSEIMNTTLHIPVGSFTNCCVASSCGMVSEENIIEAFDIPGVFFCADRYKAQLIWFSEGFVEYKIPNYFLKNNQPINLTFSLEICSEAPKYKNDWLSDITFWLNGTEICTWTSPGDFGGQRGRLNPDWWLDDLTQYGLLKTIRVNTNGTYIDEIKMSQVKLEELHIEEEDYFSLKIGIKPGAANIGGVNLFGEKFGNYSQNIIIKLEYTDKIVNV